MQRFSIANLRCPSGPRENHVSFDYSRLVRDHSRTRGPARAVMFVLASRANAEGVCWPGENRLAREAGVSKRTVIRVLPQLVAAGEVVIEHRPRRDPAGIGARSTNRYRITLKPSAGKSKLSPDSASDLVPDGPQAGDNQTPTVVTITPRGGDRLSPKSSENRHCEPSENRQQRTNGLTGQRVDYATAELPEITDYGDIFDLDIDPVLIAIAVTGERGKPAWGFWVKTLNRARHSLEREEAEQIFRNCCATLFGEMKTGECQKPGAILNMKLKAAFCLTPGPSHA